MEIFLKKPIRYFGTRAFSADYELSNLKMIQKGNRNPDVLKMKRMVQQQKGSG